MGPGMIPLLRLTMSRVRKGPAMMPALRPSLSGVRKGLGRNRDHLAPGTTVRMQRSIILMSENARAAGRLCLRSHLRSLGGDVMRKWLIFPVLVLITALSGCVSVPTGPSVMSLPGTGKSFEQFRIDDTICRQFAFEQAGGLTAQQAGQNAAVSSAIVGTALGCCRRSCDRQCFR